MATLRYRWGQTDPQDLILPARAEGVAIEIGDQIVWQGDVCVELGCWARWVALAVLPVWTGSEAREHYRRRQDRDPEALQVVEIIAAVACVPGVPGLARRYLETGAFELVSELAAVADAVYATERDAPYYIAAQATMWAIAACTREGELFETGKTVEVAAQIGAQHAKVTADRVDFLDRGELEAAMELELRRLVLQRALPESLWPLIEEAEHGPVLADALLVGQR